MNEVAELEARIHGLEARQSLTDRRHLLAAANTTHVEDVSSRQTFFSGAARVVEDRRRFGTFGLGLAVGVMVAAMAAYLVWRQ